MRFGTAGSHEHQASAHDRELGFAAYGNDLPEKKGPAI